MVSYTTSEIRNMVDELDDKIRAAITRGEIATVFAQERPILVSIRVNFWTIGPYMLIKKNMAG